MEKQRTNDKAIIVLLFLTPFLIGTGVDLYVPALPAITDYFGVSAHLVKLTIGIYMLGYGLGQIVLGVLSDSYGRKRIFQYSALFYCAVSLFAALSPNIYFLNLCRFIQGVGIAGLGVLCRAIAMDRFSGVQLTKVMTFISISFALGPILGPLIGSYLQHFFSWHADFWYFAIYGLVILVYAHFLLPETIENRTQFNIGVISRSIKTIVTNQMFVFGTVFVSLVYSSIVIFNVVGPFLLQSVLGYSVVAYGKIALLLGFGYFLGNLLNRVLISYIEPMKLVFIATSIQIFIVCAMLLISLIVNMSAASLLIPVFLLFFVCGLIFPNMMAHCVSLFPQMKGTASAAFGTTLGVSVFFMTMLPSLISVKDQKSLALIYLLVFVVCILLLYLTGIKVSYRKISRDVNENV